MPNKNYGTAMGACAWADEVDPLEPSLGQSASTWEDYNRTVAQAALQSPYVSFGIMLALAGPLPSYISARAQKKIVAETALFNIAGETTTGKTCVAMAAASVTGNSNALIDWDTSMRGVAEASTSRNDLVLILDDTEKFPGNEAALRKMLYALVQKIPAGKSTTIAKKAQASGLPLLRWSTFGLSTSTSTLFSLLDLAKKPESGDRVRGLDIRVPKRSKGGIFGSRVTGTKNAPENSGEAIRRLESALQEHYGVLFPAWMDHLLGEDMSYEILGRVERFVLRNASKNDFVEQRIAKKFGLVCAAGQLAVDAGLLAWPETWPWRATQHCLKSTLRVIKAESVVLEKTIRQLQKDANDKSLFPNCNLSLKTVFKLPPAALGIKCKYKERPALGIRDESLGRAAPGDLRKALIARLHGAELLMKGHGKVATVQIRRQMRVGERLIAKPRLWMIDLKNLRALKQ